MSAAALSPITTSSEPSAAANTTTAGNSLLFEDSGDAASEIGRLFGMAALIILVILCFVYWLKPPGRGALVQSGRRTLADTLLTLFTIFAAITFMQGIGVLLERAGIIASFNNVTQIIPILLIGLGSTTGSTSPPATARRSAAGRMWTAPPALPSAPWG